jgi:hypothetical protein
MDEEVEEQESEDGKDIMIGRGRTREERGRGNKRPTFVNS